jgi:CSLREA domain-containing protein
MSCRSRGKLGLAALGGAACVVLIATASAPAATITPTITTDENGAPAAGCSLREAIIAANTDGDHNGCLAVGTAVDEGPDTIILANGANYLRSIIDAAGDEDAGATGDLDIVDAGGGQDEDLTISAPGPSGATISGNIGATGGRVLHVASVDAVLAISRVEIFDGRTAAASGAGILNLGTVNISDSLIANNTAETNGGGAVNAGTFNATNVTFNGNFARENGGGFENVLGTATLNNVTVTGNQANTLAAAPDGVGGGIREFGGTISLSNTIVAGNSQAFLAFPGTAPDCSGTPTSLGYNLIGNTSGCGWASNTGDITNVANPGLGFGAADNGGPTGTVALQGGSPARDAGNNALAIGSGGGACAATDQRGVARPLGPRCDIGAFEAAPVPTTVPATGTTPVTPKTTAKQKCKKKKKRKRRAAASARCKKKKKKRR